MKTKEEKEEEIQNISKELQDDCQLTIDQVKKLSDNELSYQDITNAWLFYKLAEIKYEHYEAVEECNRIKQELETIQNK